MQKTPEHPEQGSNDIFQSILPHEKRKAIGTDAKWTAIALALISLVLQPIVLNTDTLKSLYAPVQNYAQPGTASLGDYITIGNIVAASAPLIAALAFMMVFVIGRLGRGEGFGMGYFGLGAIILWVAGQIGNALGFTPVRMTATAAGNPLTHMGLLLGDYATSYGTILFLSACVVAFFFARAWRILTAE